LERLSFAVYLALVAESRVNLAVLGVAVASAAMFVPLVALRFSVFIARLGGFGVTLMVLLSSLPVIFTNTKFGHQLGEACHRPLFDIPKFFGQPFIADIIPEC
jgi:hypothetical protein